MERTHIDFDIDTDIGDFGQRLDTAHDAPVVSPLLLSELADQRAPAIATFSDGRWFVWDDERGWHQADGCKLPCDG